LDAAADRVALLRSRGARPHVLAARGISPRQTDAQPETVLVQGEAELDRQWRVDLSSARTQLEQRLQTADAALDATQVIVTEAAPHDGTAASSSSVPHTNAHSRCARRPCACVTSASGALIMEGFRQGLERLVGAVPRPLQHAQLAADNRSVVRGRPPFVAPRVPGPALPLT
jgi:hypothetical protein